MLILFEQAQKIQDSEVHQCYDIVIFCAKNERIQYKKGQQDKENEKDKKNRDDKKGEKTGEHHWGNKLNLKIKKNNSFKASVYYHKIYKC